MKQEQQAVDGLSPLVGGLNRVVEQLGEAADQIEYLLWLYSKPDGTDSYDTIDRAQGLIQVARQNTQHAVFGLRDLLLTEYLAGLTNSDDDEAGEG